MNAWLTRADDFATRVIHRWQKRLFGQLVWEKFPDEAMKDVDMYMADVSTNMYATVQKDTLGEYTWILVGQMGPIEMRCGFKTPWEAQRHIEEHLRKRK